ncbi:CsbD family protein [Paracoccus sp. Z118]|uniref:CsbD family protein n=1 Tax=Paracoccus sp. Z118 TaxID=2851017 RepID=UPI001C2C6193|nr:CsbD family protein [Paracoccus sp. Z118]MBV0891700.1 CsbD family protein [Paracoccus sp. Z118]
MDADVIKGKWNQLKGSVKREWGDLTDDEITQIDGDADKLSGKLQERYGWAKTDAEEKMNDFFRRNP